MKIQQALQVLLISVVVWATMIPPADGSHNIRSPFGRKDEDEQKKDTPLRGGGGLTENDDNMSRILKPEKFTPSVCDSLTGKAKADCKKQNRNPAPSSSPSTAPDE